jgi:triosephosphate isomerase
MSLWAIGTVRLPPDQAQEMHEFIRETVLKTLVKNIENVSILYGGSVKPENAKRYSLNQMLMEA